MFINKVKVKAVCEPIVVHQACAYPGFYSMKPLGVKCLAQEHNTIMSPARALTPTARFGVGRTSYEATNWSHSQFFAII